MMLPKSESLKVIFTLVVISYNSHAYKSSNPSIQVVETLSALSSPSFFLPLNQCFMISNVGSIINESNRWGLLGGWGGLRIVLTFSLTNTLQSHTNELGVTKIWNNIKHKRFYVVYVSLCKFTIFSPYKWSLFSSFFT